MLNWKYIRDVAFAAFVLDAVLHAIFKLFSAKHAKAAIPPQHALENAADAARSKFDKPPENQNSGSTKVLFFPETETLCRHFFKSSTGCTRANCSYSHNAALLNCLTDCLNDTRLTFDLCIYLITSIELSGIITKMHAKGVKIRIITDGNYTDDAKSRIGDFRALGIPIRYNRPGPLMHHKFAILDDKVLINGSFNWTWNAIVGNHENLAVTTNDELLQPFREEFQRLWGMFDPEVRCSAMNEV